MRDGFVWKCLRGRETINVVEGKTVDDGDKEDSVPVVFANSGATAQDQAPAPSLYSFLTRKTCGSHATLYTHAGSHANHTHAS